MLSPGKYHLAVPRELKANLLYRQKALALCRSSANYRLAMMEIARRDFLYWVNVFGWQLNPKHVGDEVGPFITWPCQDETALATIDRLFGDHTNPDMLWEKSREMGATWLALFLADWVCLFHRNKSVLCISHTEEAVDKSGKRNTLFWKVDFIHKHLPKWMVQVKRRRLSFGFTGTDSIMEGSATSERSGVGGRATFILCDEYSKHGKDWEILGQTADTGPRLFIGTHYGVEKAFYHLTQRPDQPKVVLHWSRHPEKSKGLYRSDPTLPHGFEVLDKQYEFPPDYQFVRDGSPTGGPFPGIRSPWYDGEEKRRPSKRDVAMHLDINPEGSQSQFVDPLFIKRLIAEDVREPVWEGRVVLDPPTGDKRPRGGKIVREYGGPLKVWLRPHHDDSIPAGFYTLGADVSAGTGASPSCLSVENAETGEKVAAMADPHQEPREWADTCAVVGRAFATYAAQPALMAWDANGAVGEAFTMRLLKGGYPNVYYAEGQVTYGGIRRRSDRPGWHAHSGLVKSALLINYRTQLAQRHFVNRCELALREFLKFRYNAQGEIEHPDEASPQDPSGARTNHGDRVIADALACLAAKHLDLLEKAPDELPEPELHQNSLAWRRQYHRALLDEDEP